jgi:methylthioribose-1-phosphate isomerase
VNEVAKAIKTMVIRGAPHWRVCGHGRRLGRGAQHGHQARVSSPPSFSETATCCRHATTAVNRFWAIERMNRRYSEGALAGNRSTS